MRMECFATSGETPMLEKAVHVNDGEERTDNSALRRAAFAALPPLMRRLPSPSRSSAGACSHSLISHSTCRRRCAGPPILRRSECGIVSKYFRQIGVNNAGIAPTNQPVRFIDRIDRTTGEVDSHRRCPRSPPQKSVPAQSWRRSEPPDPGSSGCRGSVRRLWDHHPPHRFGPIRLRGEFLTQARQPHIHAQRVRSARKPPRPRPAHPHCREPARRRGENVLAANLS